MAQPLLEVKNLKVNFKTDDGMVKAVNDVSFYLNEGETLGIVGESGSGKSVTSLAIMRLLPSPPSRIDPTSQLIFRGRDLLKLKEDDMRRVRGREIAMIFQDPMTSLNPVLTIGKQIMESLKLHLKMTDTQAKSRAVELLKLVGIPSADKRLGDYPHQFSGGMRQRVMIAMAISCNPKLLIADEPTTALDVTIQAQILELLKKLRSELGTSIMLITHDLGVVAGMCDRIQVMYAGRIVETAKAKPLYVNPRHPYTIGLLNSIPRLDEHRAERLVPIIGLPPDMITMPPGCSFEPRCAYSNSGVCQSKAPQLREVEAEHNSACLFDINKESPTTVNLVEKVKA
ncbi:ABC transporter ATP-binding protein [Candidatus Chlorohelix sp.]|uniref:ABC transporter ATP-binding protein n=1 Tax=Candidatus Chlorohelix sp. TaxID=3139201 RepID=UPI00303D0020